MNGAVERLQSAPTISSVDEQNRTLTVRCFSGGSVKRTAWDGEAYNLLLDPRGADLSRFNTGSAPVLDSHEQRPIARQLGVVIAARETGGQIFADIRISDRPDVAGLWSDIKSGIIKNVSMGLELLAYEDQRDDSGRLITRTVTRWQPFELSFVTVPADPHATTLNHETLEVINIMEQSTITTTPAAPAASAADISRIADMCARFRISDTTKAELLTGNVSLEAARAKIFDEMATREEAFKTIPAQVTTDSADHVRNGMTEALAARLTGTAPNEQARQFVGMTIAQMAREYLNMKGNFEARRASDSRTIELALSGAGTSDFPLILANSANKSLLASYQAAESPLKRIARRAVAKDYKLMSRVRLGEFPTLEKVNEHGEYHHGAIGETGETYRVADYGRIVAFTRQALINDDLSAFGDGLRLIGSAAADKEAALLVELLTANNGVGPTMADGKALFHAGHKNLATSGSGSALALPALTAARLAMRTQTAIDGKTIVDARPKYLVLPANLETSGQQVLATIQATKTSDFNPFGGLLELTVEPRLDAISTTRWYLAADPGLVPCIEYAYLGAAMGPEIMTRVGFEVDGLEVKCRLTFGAGVLDYRGIYASPGA